MFFLQTVAFSVLVGLLQNLCLPQSWQSLVGITEHPVSVADALKLRAAFRSRLVYHQMHLQIVNPCQLAFGGNGG